MPRGRTIYDVRPDIDETKQRQRAGFPEIIEEDFWEAYDSAKCYSMLNVPGFYSMYQSVRYIAANDIPGDLVECGVFLGGASIFLALMRDRFALGARTVHMFDTFEGPPIGSKDRKFGKPTNAPRFKSYYDFVVRNVKETVGLDGVEFHIGEVERTLDEFEPRPLALARLDTDFYPGTRRELEVLYPMLSAGGVLIVDDYGIYEGSRRATDEYFECLRPQPLLQRVNMGTWAGTKPQASVSSPQ